MSSTYVALLRGINVGRAKRVAMSDLRTVVGGLGYTDVRTLLNSGNVVLTGRKRPPRAIGADIQKAVAEYVGVSARVIVLTAAELAEVVADNTLLHVAREPTRLMVAFLADPADRSKLEPLAGRDWGTEVMALGRRAAYLWCPDGILASRLLEAVGRILGDAVTMRNWATVTKLSALVSSPVKQAGRG